LTANIGDNKAEECRQSAFKTWGNTDRRTDRQEKQRNWHQL